MPDILKANIVLTVVSFIVFLVFQFHPSSIFLIQMLSLAVFLLFSILRLLQFKPLHTKHIKSYRWLVLFFTLLFIFLSLLSTGGIYSPLLSLISLAVLGLSFFFSFTISTLFLATEFFILTIHALQNPLVINQFLQNPSLTILNAISMIMVLPIAYLLAMRYHAKETLTQVITNQLTVEETILSEVNDLVFVVDKNSTIFSVNDAAERALRKPKSLLLNKPLFDHLFLKNSEGNMLGGETIKLQTILKENDQKIFENIEIFADNFPVSKKVDMVIKPIHNLIDAEPQLIVIVSERSQSRSSSVNEDTAITRLNATVERLKQQLRAINPELAAQLLFIAKTEKEVLLTKELAAGIAITKVPIDVAQLCSEVTGLEQELAQALKVKLTYTPGQTDSFFTNQCDMKYTRLALEKLVDIGVYIAADSRKQETDVSINYADHGLTQVIIRSTYHESIPGNEQNILKPYYGILSKLPCLSSASGLEGYVAKSICTLLKIPLTVTIDKHAQQMQIILDIK